MRDRDRAVQLLTHYFELVATRAGIKWHSDNTVEVTEIVDAIIGAAVDEIADCETSPVKSEALR